jgi:hypothetical protein
MSLIIYNADGDLVSSTALTDNNLDHLIKVTDGVNNYPNTVTNSSILAKLMTKTAAGADATTFNNTTDSLEAIADAIDALPTTAEANAEVDTALNTIVPASPTVGSLNDILSKAAGGNTFNKATDSLESIGEDTDALIAANPSIMATGTLTTSSTTVPADTGRAEVVNYWNGCVLIPLTGDAALQPRKIATFTNATGVFTLEQPFTTAPGTVAYVIVPSCSDGALHWMDIWCTAQTNNVTITTAGADKDFPDVVVAAQGAARGLPLGAIPKQVYPMMIFDLLDTSAAANYIKTAADDIRVKISTEVHWADATIFFTTVAGDWYTPASGMSSQVIPPTTDVIAQVTATGAGTYNFGSDETENTKAIETQGATLAFKNMRTGLRFGYKMP